MGILTVDRTLSQCEKVSVSAFCRRRIGIVMVRLKMAETVREAVTFVEQGRELTEQKKAMKQHRILYQRRFLFCVDS
jgi:U3 small nucleolar ribonucleoprotein protein IMP3